MAWGFSEAERLTLQHLDLLLDVEVVNVGEVLKTRDDSLSGLCGEDRHGEGVATKVVIHLLSGRLAHGD